MNNLEFGLQISAIGMTLLLVTMVLLVIIISGLKRWLGKASLSQNLENSKKGKPKETPSVFQGVSDEEIAAAIASSIHADLHKIEEARSSRKK